VNLDSWLHFMPVLAAIVWVGGGFMLVLIALRARSRSNPASITAFARMLPCVGLGVLMPAVLLVLVTGVWMVFENSQWKFSLPWVLLAQALFAVAFLVGAVYLSRVGIQLERMMRSSADTRRDLTASAGSLKNSGSSAMALSWSC
jgi:uncharacterized membrane protein